MGHVAEVRTDVLDGLLDFVAELLKCLTLFYFFYIPHLVLCDPSLAHVVADLGVVLKRTGWIGASMNFKHLGLSDVFEIQKGGKFFSFLEQGGLGP